MSTIELSAGFSSGLASRMFAVGNTTGPYTYAGITFLGGSTDVYYLGNAVRSTIYIYTGTIPTSGLINYTTQAANILAAYAPPTTNSVYTNNASNTYNTTTCVYSNNTISISTLYATAYASGTATWFALVSTGAGSGSPGIVGQSIYGNIGVQGSGADLEIASTTFVAGSYYRIQDLRITIPNSWTY